MKPCLHHRRMQAGCEEIASKPQLEKNLKLFFLISILADDETITACELSFLSSP